MHQPHDLSGIRRRIAELEAEIAEQLGLLERILKLLSSGAPLMWRATLLSDLVHASSRVRRAALELDLRDVAEVATAIRDVLSSLSWDELWHEHHVLETLQPFLATLPDVLRAELSGRGLDPARLDALLDRLGALQDVVVGGAGRVAWASMPSLCQEA